MSKKILKSPFSLFKGKKKAQATDAKPAFTPEITALSPEETRRRKLLRGQPAFGTSTSIIGNAGTSSTLGG
jgi:hypothetical protein